ncbi:MAG: hypothetical protein IBX62_01885 [Coriobacteriia bacterium]|nr:hypothetical protein [Coriobacteriia bacterium]
MWKRRGSGWDDLYALLRDVFCGAAVTCFLWGVHRIGTSLKTDARLRALDQVGDAFTAEEREALIEKIRSRSLHL